MAGINRFYKPSSSKYVSQFVPDQLPADLMLKGLAAKQQKYDTNAALLNKFGEVEIDALKGRDTEYAQEWVGEEGKIAKFIDESMTKDLASPEFMREFQSLKKKFSTDKGLKSVASSLATHQEFLERTKKLKEGKGTDYDKNFVDKYNRNYSEYTKSTAAGGLGFEGSTQLADPSILEGVDINTETEKYFDHLKADGRETLKSLTQGLSYKDGWVGVSGKKVNQQAANVLDEYYETRAGQQLQAKFNAENIPLGMTYDQFYSSRTPEQLEAFETAKKQSVANHLINVGQGFIHSKTTTNQDVALNIKAGWDKKDKELYAQEANFQVNGNTLEIKTPTFKESTAAFEANKEALVQHTNVRDTFAKIKRGLNEGSLEQFRDKDGVLRLPPADMKLLEGLPGAKDFINGVRLSEPEMTKFTTMLDNKIEDHDYQINGIRSEQTTIQQKNIEAASEFISIKEGKDVRFGEKDLTLVEALDLGNSFDQDPAFKDIKEELQSIIDNGGDWKTALNNIKKEYEAELISPYRGIKGINAEDFTMTIDDSDLSQVEKDKIKQDHNTALQSFDDIKTWATATKVYENTMDQISYNPFTTYDYEQVYNSQKAYQPVAQVINQETDKYAQRQVDEYGQVVVTGNAYTADKQMENLFNANSDAFTVRIGSERIYPDDPRYPTDITFASANKETYNGKPTFNASKEVTVEDAWGIAPKKKVTYNYTIEATNMTNADNYFSAKSLEAKSNVLADPNYDPNLPMSEQQNLSVNGNQSLIDYTTYGDPQLAEQISKTSGLKSPGEKVFFSRYNVNPYSGKNEQINYQVKKSGSTDGGLIVEITDKAGNYLTNVPSIVVANSAQLSGTIARYEAEWAQEGEDIKSGALGLRPPTDKQAGFTDEGVYKGTTELTGQNQESSSTKPDYTAPYLNTLKKSFMFSSGN